MSKNDLQNGFALGFSLAGAGKSGGGSIEIETNISSESTNEKAAGAKAVYDAIQAAPGGKWFEITEITDTRIVEKERLVAEEITPVSRLIPYNIEGLTLHTDLSYKVTAIFEEDEPITKKLKWVKATDVYNNNQLEDNYALIPDTTTSDSSICLIADAVYENSAFVYREGSSTAIGSFSNGDLFEIYLEEEEYMREIATSTPQNLALLESDWEEKKSESLSYIRNKPFFEETSITSELILNDLVFNTLTSTWESKKVFQAEEGKTYETIFELADDPTMSQTAEGIGINFKEPLGLEFDSYGINYEDIGVMIIPNVEFDMSVGGPIYSSDNVLIVGTDGGTKFNIKITGGEFVDTVVKKIDEKFLPKQKEFKESKRLLIKYGTAKQVYSAADTSDFYNPIVYELIKNSQSYLTGLRIDILLYASEESEMKINNGLTPDYFSKTKTKELFNNIYSVDPYRERVEEFFVGNINTLFGLSNPAQCWYPLDYNVREYNIDNSQVYILSIFCNMPTNDSSISSHIESRIKSFFSTGVYSKRDIYLEFLQIPEEKYTFEVTYNE